MMFIALGVIGVIFIISKIIPRQCTRKCKKIIDKISL